jgi:multisubunit Na+/H+ antiporter MnhC subunit
MNASLVLVLLMAVMYAAGVYVMLERSITRIVIGFVLVGNATNILLLIMSGRAGAAAFWQDGRSAEDMTDPLPQALILTAIVINMGITAFLLALIYRAWWLARTEAKGAQPDEGDVVDDGDDLPEQVEDADIVFEETTADADAIQEEQAEGERDDTAAEPGARADGPADIDQRGVQR